MEIEPKCSIPDCIEQHTFEPEGDFVWVVGSDHKTLQDPSPRELPTPNIVKPEWTKFNFNTKTKIK